MTSWWRCDNFPQTYNDIYLYISIYIYIYLPIHMCWDMLRQWCFYHSAGLYSLALFALDPQRVNASNSDHRLRAPFGWAQDEVWILWSWRRVRVKHGQTSGTIGQSMFGLLMILQTSTPEGTITLKPPKNSSKIIKVIAASTSTARQTDLDTKVQGGWAEQKHMHLFPLGL